MEKLSFLQQLILVVVENGIIAIVLLLIGELINRNLAKFKSKQARLLELEKQNLMLRNRIEEDKRERKLKDIDDQLSEFYFPILYRLQKDDALWQLSPKLSNKEGALPMETNDFIEKEYILKNHSEIIEIIESKSHLIEPNEDLQEQIREYIKHVAIYVAIREIDSFNDLSPKDLGSYYPKGFQEIIKSKIEKLQNEHNKILNKITF